MKHWFFKPSVMKVSRQDLIKICDKFQQDEIGRQEVEDFAWNLITSDEHEWDDEIIADTLFEWDNEEINVPINKVNMQLWKQRLLTSNDDSYQGL
jgi:Glu-tRNA(Gln) amidotransferase subunit E-like FAD-binding protein